MQMLEIYEKWREKFVAGKKIFYRQSSVFVKISGIVRRCFSVRNELKQGLRTSPRLFFFYMGGVVREVRRAEKIVVSKSRSGG